MCLVALAFRQHPEYPLVVVANRDEFYDRKASAAHFWDDHPNLLAGRDLQAGGTWFGVNRFGQWATVTNYPGGDVSAEMRSRGDLPRHFLSPPVGHQVLAPHSPAEYIRRVAAEANRFRGFSFLAGDVGELAYCSNASTDGKGLTENLSPGIYTLSNDVLNTPWPKAQYAHNSLAAALEQAGKIQVDSLLGILGSREQFPDHQLPDSGLGLEMDRVLSPPFIVSESYGTRCTTVLLIGSDGSVNFSEQSYHRGKATGRKDFSFTIDRFSSLAR